MYTNDRGSSMKAKAIIITEGPDKSDSVGKIKVTRQETMKWDDGKTSEQTSYQSPQKQESLWSLITKVTIFMKAEVIIMFKNAAMTDNYTNTRIVVVFTYALMKKAKTRNW